MASLPLGTVIAVTLMVFVTAAVCLPVFFELFLVLADALGWNVRSRPWILKLTEMAGSISDAAEYGVALITLGLIGVPIYLHVSEFAPFWTESHKGHHDPWTHVLFLHILPSLWINSNMLYHFYKAYATPPGSPTVEKYPSCGRVCGLCDAPKPARAHHCSTCNKCVLDMDHHCPFTANCVGKGNHQYFLLFIFYSWVATAYAFWLCWHPYTTCLSDAEHEHYPKELCAEWTTARPRLFYVSLAALTTLSVFFAFLLYLQARNQTTIEFLSFSSGKRNRDALMSHYRQQGLLHNLQGKLGPARYWTYWLVPVPFLHRRVPEYQDLLVPSD